MECEHVKRKGNKRDVYNNKQWMRERENKLKTIIKLQDDEQA